MTNTKPKKTTKTKTTPYDVADHLRTSKEMAAYLDAWFEQAPDDAAGIARALGDIARAKGAARLPKTRPEPCECLSGAPRRRHSFLRERDQDREGARVKLHVEAA